MRRTLLILSIAWAVAAIPSCGGGPAGGERVCPSTVIAARLQSGSITFTIGDGSPETRPLVGRKQRTQPEIGGPDPGACLVDEPASTIAREVGVGGSSPAYVECAVSTGILETTSPYFGALGLAPGRNALPPFVWALLEQNRDDDHPCQYAPEISAFADVTRAMGGPAPYPAIVTRDYVLDFSLHMEWGSTGSTPESDATCPTLAATVDFQFTETAADTVNYPRSSCLAID